VCRLSIAVIFWDYIKENFSIPCKALRDMLKKLLYHANSIEAKPPVNFHVALLTINRFVYRLNKV